MAEQNVHEWMALAALDEGQAIEESTLIAEFCGEVDLGTVKLGAGLTELQVYIGKDQEDAIVVARGLKCIHKMLTTLQTETLKRHDVHAVVQYLCDRLSNTTNLPNYNYGLGEIAEMLTILIAWRTFLPDDCELICKSSFALALNGRSTFMNQTNKTRCKFYTLLAMMEENFPNKIEKNLGIGHFVAGLLNLAETEKGPASLKVLFELYSKIGKEWNPDASTIKAIWESIWRYFPVTLGAAVTNPEMPQPGELRQLLLDCVVSNDHYAQESIPSLLQDLDGSLANKKIEIFATLYACVTSYSVPTLFQWAQKIWDALKFEIWNGEVDDDINESLRIIHGLVTTLGTPETHTTEWIDHNPFAKFISEVAEECFSRLSDMERYVLPSGRILYAIGSASPYALHLVIRKVLPRLDVLAQDSTTRVLKKSLIGVYNYILQARLDLATEFKSSLSPAGQIPQVIDEARQAQEQNLTASLTLYQQAIVEVYFGTMAELNGDDTISPPNLALCTAAMEGLVTLTLIPSFLSAAEKGIIMQALLGVVTNLAKNKDLQQAALIAIRRVSYGNPDDYQNLVLPTLIKQLPSSLSTNAEERSKQIEHIERFLENLIQVTSISVRSKDQADDVAGRASFKRNHDSFQLSLFGTFEAALKQPGQIDYANLILATALRSLQLFDSAENDKYSAVMMEDGAHSKIVFRYLNRFLTLKTQSDGASYIGLQNLADEKETFDDNSVRLLGKLITAALSSESAKKTNDFYSVYEENKDEDVPSPIASLFVAKAPKNLSETQFDLISGPPDKSAVVYLIASILAGIPKKSVTTLQLSGINVTELASTMVRNAVSTDLKCTKFQRLSMISCVQLLINKYGANGNPKSLTGPVADEVINLVYDISKKSEQEADNIYWLLAYFTSASLTAWLSCSDSLVERMVSALTSLQHGRKVAQSFRILLVNSDLITQQNGCTLRLMRNQVLYEQSMKRLLSLWRVSKDKTVKENALIAIAGVLAYMPEAILQENADHFFPAVLSGTDIQNEEWSKSAFITIIRTLVPICPKTIESHLDSVINRMTDRTHNTYDSPSDSSIKCRVLALEVLRLLAEHVKPALLVNRKFKVVGEIDVALDDCSREVSDLISQFQALALDKVTFETLQAEAREWKEWKDQTIFE
ncbi:Dos2-interacting transcription regulator of RNA-Pol-II-domain-containing protein [Halenospora varia]|nr:Dos2-interacting transcription regulator of RNA-Pol-II-domain-containing protein [Halenospora varia]